MDKKSEERGGPLHLPGDFGEALGDLLKVQPPRKATASGKKAKKGAGNKSARRSTRGRKKDTGR